MKKIIAILTIGLFTVSAFAQTEQRKHEFSIWAGGGLSSLEYDLTKGDHTSGIGGLAGIGYNYFFHYNWSVGIGAEFSLLQAKADMMNTNHSSVVNNGFGNIEWVLNSKFEEKQTAYYLNIPVKLQYQVDVYKRNKLYAAIGAKVGLPIMDAKAKYEGDYSIIGYGLNASGDRMNGVDPYQAGVYGMSDYGFVNGGVQSEKDFTLADLNIIGTLELGMKWPVKSGKNAWYTGVFFDYGFSDIRDLKNQDYTTQGNVIASNLIKDKVNTMSFGAKVAFAFGFGNKHVKAVKEEKPFEGVTPAQMDDMLKKNTGIIVDAMDRNFEELYKHLEKECPELFEPIPTDELEAIVQFDFDKDNVKQQYFPDIDRKVAILNKYPEVRMTLIGHTDDRGTEQYNYNLGLERAQAVKDYMVAKGIAANRLYVESKGKTQPIVSNTTEENRYKNRRVEFELKQ